MKGEAEVCLRALRVASDLGMSRIIVQVDASNMATALQSAVCDFSCIDMIISEAWELSVFGVHGGEGRVCSP